MVIVIVHWKIHPHAEARREFLDHWRDRLKLDQRDEFIGEYLSEPVLGDDAGFLCTLFNVPLNAKYWSFFNVGVWRSVDAFRRNVIDPFVTKQPRSLPFEYEFRERMVLDPVSWRVGRSDLLPPQDHFS